MDFKHLSLIDLAAQVREKSLSAEGLAKAALENIKNLDGTLNSFCAVDAELALADAIEIDKRIANGKNFPLAGIPIGVKDLEDAAGFVTSFGSPLHINDAPATSDSVLVARLKAAGCVVIGKTNTPEFGHKGETDNDCFGITRNPWNTDYIAGGSSGGSAAALAGGLVPLTTGSDGGGSIRIPASVCGFSAIKTSQGRIPLGGVSASGSGLLSVKGPMAKTSLETAYVLDYTVGNEKTDIFSLPDKTESWFEAVSEASLPETVIYSPTMGFAEVDSEIASICQAAIDKLEAAGVRVILLDKIWSQNPVQHWLVLWHSARARAQQHLQGTADWAKISATLRPMIEAGANNITGPQYASAIDAAHHMNYQLEQAFRQAPIIITPATAGHIPKVGEQGAVNDEQRAGWVTFGLGLNMTRNPAGVVTVASSSFGLPVGLQIIGSQQEDLTVLKAMVSMEQLYGQFRL